MNDWVQIHTKVGASKPYQVKCPCGWRSDFMRVRKNAEKSRDAHAEICDYGKDED